MIEMVMLLGTLKLKHCEFLQHRELPVLNGCRVDVRQSELAPIAIDDEASKKSVSMVYYENHNYSKLTGRLYHADGSYVQDPGFVDYGEGEGVQVCGGECFDAEGKHIGHAEDPGHKGVQGCTGYSRAKGNHSQRRHKP
jgi:hypothetical protein